MEVVIRRDVYTFSEDLIAMLPTSAEDVSDILVHKLISGLRLFEKIDSKNW